MKAEITPAFIAATLDDARRYNKYDSPDRKGERRIANRKALIAIIESFQEGDSYMNVCRIASEHRVERDAAREKVEYLRAENKRLQEFLSPEAYLKFVQEKNRA